VTIYKYLDKWTKTAMMHMYGYGLATTKIIFNYTGLQRVKILQNVVHCRGYFFDSRRT